MITHTRRTALAALAILSLATIASTPHASAAAPNSHVSTRERYTLPAAVAGCRPTPDKPKHWQDGSTSVTFHCHPAGHPGTTLVYLVNVGNASAADARTSSDLFRVAVSRPMFKDGAVQTHRSGPVWTAFELGSDGDRFTIGGPQHRVVVIVTVFFHNDDDGGWAIDQAGKVTLALVKRIP